MAKKEVLFCDLCKEQIKLDLIELPDPNSINSFKTISTIGGYHVFGLDACKNCKKIIDNLIEIFPELPDVMEENYG